MEEFQKDLITNVLEKLAEKNNLILGSLELLKFDVSKDEFDILFGYLVKEKMAGKKVSFNNFVDKYIETRNLKVNLEDVEIREELEMNVKKLLIGMRNEGKFVSIINDMLE